MNTQHSWTAEQQQTGWAAPQKEKVCVCVWCAGAGGGASFLLAGERERERARPLVSRLSTNERPVWTGGGKGFPRKGEGDLSIGYRGWWVVVRGGKAGGHVNNAYGHR